MHCLIKSWKQQINQCFLLITHLKELIEWTYFGLLTDKLAAARLVFSEPRRAHVTPLFYLLALAPGCSSHQVQDTDACIYNSHRLSILLLSLTYDNLHPLQKSEICERALSRGTITERHKITLQNVFIHHSWLVKLTSHPHFPMLNP